MALSRSQLRRQLRSLSGPRRARRGGSNGEPPQPPPEAATAEAGRRPAPAKRKRPRLKKLRIAIVVLGLGMLAFVSWIFGIMMAVAQDLPSLENRAQYVQAKNSVVYDVNGKRIATLTGSDHRILLDSDQIAPTIKEAVVAIEDQRFYEHNGVDYLGIARAVYQDILSGGATQGGSTITEQFVKNALAAQNSRTVFEKLREAALAYHLERQWSKDKILTEYLNTIYFGEGAYGIESAAETYFGWNHPGCGTAADSCASELLPEEAAMLAGIISSPSAYDPRLHPEAAVTRRNLVLQKMVEQGTLTQDQYDQASQVAPPAPKDINPPTDNSVAPFFTDWLRQQVINYYGAGQAFGGGLQIHSTLDLTLQHDVEDIARNTLAGVTPTASIVVMDNNTAAVRAMVGGPDYNHSQFDIATDGYRQPGSAWKPFTLVTALEQGHTLDDLFVSEPKVFRFKAPGYKKKQNFVVNNYGNEYRGTISLATATAYSDNSVYAQLGLQVGTDNIAKTAHDMGIETKISTNPAMILGGLEQGVTPMELTHAYVTLAHDGQRVSGSLAADQGGPVAISSVTDSDGNLVPTDSGEPGDNQIETQQVIPPGVAAAAKGALENVVNYGTGTAAAYGGYVWGKTGTTENNGDAWFCGATHDITACVWVGHPDSNQSMSTDYNGGPVVGGTYPAEIWRQVVLAYNGLHSGGGTSGTSTAPSTGYTPAPSTSAPAPPTSSPDSGSPSSGSGSSSSPAPSAPAPSSPAPSAPAPSGGSSAGGVSAG